jgi:hypothetical protein
MHVLGIPRFAAFCLAAGLAALVAGCGLDAYGTEDPDAAAEDAGLDGSADVSLDTPADVTTEAAPDVAAETGADAAPDASIPCTTSTQCKSTNPCKTGTCNTSTSLCVFTNVADGTPTPGVTPVTGTCHQHVCMGGVDTNAVDNANLPAAVNDCETPTCTSGTPGQSDRAADSACSSFMATQPGFCDGMGHCVQCTKSSECPGTTTDCQAPACTNNSCGTHDTPSGTATTGNPPQVAGDCQTIECNGSGGTMSVADNADTPPAKACQIPACTSGTPSYSNASNGTACGTGLACVNGACSGCTMNSQCQPPAYDTCGGGGTANTCGCTATTCAALGDTCGTPSNGCGGTLACNDTKKDGNETDVDCGGNVATCTNRCAQGKKCNITADCAGGLTCTDGVCCNSACGGSCEACTKAKTGQPSGVDGLCQPVASGVPDPRGVCTSSAASTCGDEGGLCNGSGACATWPNGTVCQAASCSGATTVIKTETCAGGTCTSSGQTDCTPYRCAAGACTATCNVDGDCASGSYYCNASHQCTLRLTQGAACITGGSATQCQSGNCVDGFCCNSACNTQCQACSNALTGGANGTCGNVNPGTADPSGTCTVQAPTSCGTDGLCAAGGACQDYTSGSVCVSASCSMGQQTTQGVCNGTGMCTGSMTTSCAPYICGATACLTACPSNDATGDADCSSGNWCNGTACVPAQMTGGMCTRASQCTSAMCAGDAGMMTCN